ncbi:hypothetical protein EP331_02300 [bacterium]|nr:MAG: hypothetical protein EP331_02300 [bacterium]
MTEHIALGLTLVIVIGIGAQWIAWKTKLPSILLLLIAGLLIGPGLNWVNADALFGNTLFPIVSLSVAIILFEGGLSLRFSEIKGITNVVRNLISIAIVITWVLSGLAAHYILELDWDLAILFGAILIVTGPTVIIPLLRQVRPSGQVGAILKWEGIVNDPIGAMFAVIVFEVLLSGGIGSGVGVILAGVSKTVIFGSLVGAAGAYTLIIMIKRNLMPEFLQNPVSLAIVIGAFEFSNILQSESGLWAVTLMGIILANQKKVELKQILEFKENLRVILIASLFILLASRINLESLQVLNWNSLAFLGASIILIRPLSVFLSTIKTGLSWKEKLFVSAMAPRGIVAAAVTSLFSIRLSEIPGYESAALLVPYIFVVIIGSVAIYGLSASPLARKLGLAQKVPTGTLFVGGHRWALDLALLVKKAGFDVMIADSNSLNISKAKAYGFKTYHGNILSEFNLDELNLDGIGHLVALTPNDEVNALACIKFSEIFGKTHVFQVAKTTEGMKSKLDNSNLGGEILGNKVLSCKLITDVLLRDGQFTTMKLSRDQSFSSLLSQSEYSIIPLLYVSDSGSPTWLTSSEMMPSQVSGRVIALKYREVKSV